MDPMDHEQPGTAGDGHEPRPADPTKQMESDEQFRRAVEDAPIPMIMQAEDGQVLQLSRSWTQLTGYALADVPSFDAWLRSAYGPGADAVREHVHDLFAGHRRTLDVEFEVRTRDGDLRHWSFSASSPGTLRDGRRFIVGMAQDITERTRVERALAEQARLLDLSNDAIIVRDTDNRIISWNRGATEIYGWTRDEAVGQDLHTLLRTEFERPFPELISLLHEHDRMEGEVVQVTRDGRRLTLLCRWALDRDAAGRPGAILTTYNDITERKQAQAARAEAEAALAVREQFIAMASHELHTPLTALLGSTEMLQTTVAQGQPISQRTLERLLRQTRRLDALINQMLDIARLQGGQFALERQPLDLVALIAHSVEEFRRGLLPAGPHTLECSAPDHPVLILGDPQRLEQVLANLLGNAVKYSPGGGVVRVRLQQGDGQALLDVSDVGIGIPREAQEQLFAPFYRAANVGTQASGFGIGLYVVHEIIQRHGGQMRVESQEGVGSTFRVSLPLLKEHGEDAGML